MKIAPAALRDSVAGQIGALRDIAAREGVALERVKAHGALYNEAHRDEALASVIVEAMALVDPALAIVASNTSKMADAARARGMSVVREAFADRRYEPTGALVSRSQPDALLSVEEAARQAALLASERRVIARDGASLALEFDTICIHADMEHSVERLRGIRAALFG